MIKLVIDKNDTREIPACRLNTDDWFQIRHLHVAKDICTLVKHRRAAQVIIAST